jgi:hydrogenase/urease accessory protein HupE
MFKIPHLVSRIPRLECYLASRIPHLVSRTPYRFSFFPFLLLLLAIFTLPAPAEAHLNSTGMGPIYDGLMHFLVSPEDLVPVLALALLTGLRGADYGRRALFVLPSAWLFGAVFGLTASATNGSAVLSSMWFLLLGGLLAADAKLSLRATATLAVLIGLYHGYLNGTGMGASGYAGVALLGLVFAVFVLVALAAAFVVRLSAEWTRIAVRVAGSWIAASGLLMLGWSFRGS